MMKKLLFFAASLMATSAIYALPVYNPGQPDFLRKGVLFQCCTDWAFEIGYRGDFVFDRRLKQLVNQLNFFDYQKALCDFQSSINAAQLTLHVWDRLDVYTWVGNSQTSFEAQVDFVQTAAPLHTGFLNLNARTKQEAAYGFGVRAVLWECRGTSIGVDLQYSYQRNKLECFSINGKPIQSVAFDAGTALPLKPEDFNLRKKEYQVALGISHRICGLIPYAAVKYSRVKGWFKGPLSETTAVLPATNTINPRMKFRSKNRLGIAIGASLVNAERMHVTAEGRLIDEVALTLASEFRF